MPRLVVMLLFATAAMAGDKVQLPPWFPPANGQYEMVRRTFRAFDEAQIPLDRKLVAVPDPSHPFVRARGKYWAFDMKSAKPEAWTSLAEHLVHEGFRFVSGDTRSMAKGVASFQKGEGDHATYVKFSQCCNSVYIVEVAPNPFHVALHSPGTTPEVSGTTEAIPYLPPLDGGKLAGGHDVHRPMSVLPDCKGKPEPFGTLQTWRRYDGPPEISDVAVRDAYETALRAAGWEQFCEAGSHSVSAHFTKNGRDIWVNIAPTIPREGQGEFRYEVTAADARAGLREDLQKNCKASLYGVNFDFNKASLRPEAEPALNQLLVLLKDDPKLIVEIGGHTDNVGNADYNMKLSDERAAAVRQWLVQRGIAANRLASHGYGDTQPLAPNTDDENRAKNRRVEVKRTNCR